MTLTAELNSLDLYRERARALLVEEHMPISEAVDQLLEEIPLDKESARFLIRQGLISWLNNDRHNDQQRQERFWSHRKDPVFQRSVQRTPHGKKAWSALLICLEAADGSMQSLYDFSVADWQHQRDRAGQLAKTWLKRSDTCEYAAQLLTENGCIHTRDLDERIQEQLAERVIETWLS